jgi:TPR repeat protein
MLIIEANARSERCVFKLIFLKLFRKLKFGARMPWKQSLVVCVIGLIGCAADAQQETPSVGCDRYAASDYVQAGSGIPFDKIDPTVAIPACEEAIRQDPNSARFAFQLGRSKLKADDYDSALRLFHQAADRGFAPAFGSIGSMYLEGKGVAKDEHMAFDWLMKAAVRGFAGSQMSLGYVFENGLGVSQDYAAAFKWYHLAAVQGFPSAQDSVGYFYAKGLGVHQDDREAALWIAKAARQGMAGAQYNLGTMYESGQGVPTSRSVAMTWYKKAADQGNADAKKKLTRLGASETSIGSLLHSVGRKTKSKSIVAITKLSRVIVGIPTIC